jgi:hypothetical protein
MLAAARTNKVVGILLQTQIRHEVCALLFRPFCDDAGGAALAIPRVGEGGGRVFGTHGAGISWRALRVLDVLGVLDRQAGALDHTALVVGVNVGVVVVVVVFGCLVTRSGQCCHGAGHDEGAKR